MKHEVYVTPMDKKNIRTTDWLVKGYSQEELTKEKEETIKGAEIELMAIDLNAIQDFGVMNIAGEEYLLEADEVAEKLYDKSYRKVQYVAKEIFEQLYANIKFDGHTIGVWKNDLIKIAEEYGISLE